MRKEEVPQDDENLMEGNKELQYALDENGNYITVKSAGWEPKNIVLKQAWEEINENIQDALEAIENGTKSPIYFFMHKNIMDIRLLSEYTGFWTLTIKRHFKPSVFKKLSPEKLEIYRNAFRLDSIDDLTNFDVSKYKNRS